MIERYSRPEMTQLWAEDAKYAAWAEVERAHLEVLVEQKAAPADTLAQFDRALTLKTAADFLRKEQETGHDVIAFVAELSEAMGDSGRFLHLGLTSSDVVDTAQCLRLQRASALVLQSLATVREAFAFQAYQHAQVPCIGRTHGIHAEPTSFGVVLAGHFAEFQRGHLSLLQAKKETAVGKLSGAVGTFSQLSPEFEARVLAKLGLTPETVATQVVPRDRILRLGQAIENISNAVDRFCLNLRHWARSELGEVLEPFSAKQKGSSAMPHKKNPILAENLCGLARTVRGYTAMLTQNVALWHERDISHSSVERIVLPDLFTNAHFMLERLKTLVMGMQVRSNAMEANLGKLGGLWASQTTLTALVEKGMGRQDAYELIQSIALPINDAATSTGVARDAFLRGLCASNEVTKWMSQQELESLFDVQRFLKFVPSIFKRAFGMVPEEFHRAKHAEEEFHNAYQMAKENSDTTLQHVFGAKNLAALQRVPALQKIYHVTVQLLPDVLDTEAETISSDMYHQHLPLHSLRQTKTFVVRAAGDLSLAQLTAYANSVLHNAVMEQFSVEVVQ